MTKISSFVMGFVLLTCFLPVCLTAQNSISPPREGVPWSGPLGVSRTTGEIMKDSRAAESRLLGRMPRLSIEHEVERDNLPQNPESPDIARFPLNDNLQKQQRIAVPLSPQILGTTFLGATFADALAFPPDCMGTIGPTQFIVAINGRIRSFNKTTGIADGVLNVDTDIFFASVMSTNPGTFTTDPRIRYDRLSGRWFIIMIDVPAGTGAVANRAMLAVSSGGTITGSTVWTFFYFAPNPSQFGDYPTLGIDKFALYVGFNMFSLSGSYQGTMGYVIRKSSVLSTGPIVATSLGSLAAPGGPGLFTPQGVDNFDTTATEGYFIGADNASYGLLQIRRVSNPGTSPSLSGNLSITIPATDASRTVPHLGNTGGTNGYLDALDDRLYMAVIRNGRLWTTHNLAVNSSGTTTSPDRDGSRWYEIGSLTTTPTLIQSGTVYDNSTNVRSYWIPSVNISGQEHIAMGFSVAGANDRINGATCGRLSTDATGTMQALAMMTGSTTAYNPTADPGGATGRRWGDYSYTSVDPDDDMTMWTIQEFCNATDSWGVQAVKLIAPPPALPVSATPDTVSTNSTNVSVTVTGTSSSGSGFFDPGAAFANRISATVNGGGVTVTSIDYLNPSHIVLHVNVAQGAAPGARTISVTNPDSQSLTSAAGILTIRSISCPTITVAPLTLPAGTAGIAYSQSITASGGISPYRYTVTLGSLPTGITLSAGGLLSGTPSFGGSYNFTITATDSVGCTGAQAYTLAISGCPQITLSPATLPGGVTGGGYSQSFTASGGTAPYIYTLTAGLLPAGLLLSTGGALTGTPTAAGSYNFTITATDANSCSGSRAYSLSIVCPTITVTPTTLPGGTINIGYSQSLTASGGTSPYSFAVTSGVLPSGLTLSAGGLLSGTPVSGGISNFTVTATDTYLCIGARAFSLTISGLSSNSTSLTAFGVTYYQSFNTLVSTGTGDSTKIPAGWMFTETGTNANTTYTAGDGSSNTGDTYSYGATGDTDRAFGGLVSSSLVPWFGGNFVNNTGGTITSLDISYTGEEWRLGATGKADTLQFQLSTDATTLLSGTWTTIPVLNFTSPVTTGTIGALNGNLSSNRTFLTTIIPGLSISNGTGFMIRWKDINVTGSDDGLAVDDFSLTPNGSIPITNPSVTGTAVPDSVVQGGAVSLAATVTPGTNPASTGLAVTADLTSIGGTAGQPFYDDGTHGDVVAGDHIFTYMSTIPLVTPTGLKSIPVNVTDLQGRTGSTTIVCTILQKVCPVITVTPFAGGTTGIFYIQTAVASGGTPPYKFAMTGILPPGLTADSTGKLQGTPHTAGLFIFTTTATDSFDCTGSRIDSVNIVCPVIVIDPVSLPDAVAGSHYSQTINATGGTSPYHFNIFSGIPPPGIDISASGLLSGTPLSSGDYSFIVHGTDTNGCTGSRSYTLHVGTAANVTYPVVMEQRWNLISLPVTVQNDSVSVLFPGATSRAFSYNPSGYKPEDRLTGGHGYWLKFGIAETIRITGSPLFVDSIAVHEGWNLIGSVSDPVRSALIGSITPGIITSSAFGYNGRYIPSDTVFPGRAYWIKVNRGDTLILSSIIIQRSSNKIRIERTGEIPPPPPDVQGTGTGPIPAEYALEQNVPSPFNPSTTIHYQLPVESRVHLRVYNLLGQIVATLIDADQDAGYMAVEWNASGFASGVYFYRIEAVSLADPDRMFTQVRKMTYLR